MSRLPAASARCPAGSCSGRPTTPRCSRWSARCVTTITSWNRRPTSSGGDRLSPKITVGLMPTAVLTPYASYAEGYRAPSITETLVNGPHAGATVNDSFFRCPSGTPGPGADSTFCFVPNPNLRPEVGKNKEIGFNLKKNDLFTPGDSIRGKFNVFRNDITDYHRPGCVRDAAPVPTGRRLRRHSFCRSCSIRTLPQARIQGFEAETMYDASLWYRRCCRLVSSRARTCRPALGCTASRRRRSRRRPAFGCSIRTLDALCDVDVGDGEQEHSSDLYAGDRRTTWSTSICPVPADAGSHAQFLGREPSQPVLPALRHSGRQSRTTTQNDVKWASAGPGIVFKGGLRYHFGGT